MTERPVITLDPPWWRCENGTEFRSGQNKPSKCPVCGSTEIEMVVEVAPEAALGGDEPFCEHGNLLWSEDCDECNDALMRISDAITAAAIRGSKD